VLPIKEACIRCRSLVVSLNKNGVQKSVLLSHSKSYVLLLLYVDKRSIAD
jgi:hypothetical protein